MTATAEDFASREALYNAAFEAECRVQYPIIDEFEQSVGFHIERERLEQAARVLACPLKRNRACWQHGRIVYAMGRRVLARVLKRHVQHEQTVFLDIGTAKGFSALMMQYAIEDSGIMPSACQVISLDVIDPEERTVRNTVVELSGLLTLAETLRPWQHVTDKIRFIQSEAANWLLRLQLLHIHFAFIDGKHSFDAVNAELAHLARLQRSGDVLVIDDVQIEGVMRALSGYRHAYTWQTFDAKPSVETENLDLPHAPRFYAVAIRR